MSEGFFYVTGHGLETEYLKSLLAKGHQFFQLPQSTKESIHISKSMDGVRGWQKVSSANTTKWTH
jgi:isopenicillin N synthase-like dioxygenase